MQLPLKRFTLKGKKVIFLLTQQTGSDDMKVDDEALISTEHNTAPALGMFQKSHVSLAQGRGKLLK